MALKSKKWLDVQDLHTLYGIAPSTKHSTKKNRKIPYAKVIGHIRYSRDKIDAWIESHMVEVMEVVA